MQPNTTKCHYGLQLNAKDKIKFIKTKTPMDKQHNNIILLNNFLEYSHLKNVDSITYNVEFLYKNKIVPTILYCDRKYIQQNGSGDF